MSSPAPDTPPAEPTDDWVLRRVIHQIAADIDSEHEYSTGERAQLRRLSPDDLAAPVFWKLSAKHLIPNKLLPEHPSRSGQQEDAWAVIVSCMAQMRQLHQAWRRPGHALRDARFSELRLIRLLRSRDRVLFDNLRGVARYLASKGEPVDWTDLAALALYPEGPFAENLRRRLASDFYAQSPAQPQE